MTELEIILIAILWILLGFWIAWKRQWYDEYDDDSRFFIVMISIILMPINFLIVFIKVFICTKWLDQDS